MNQTFGNIKTQRKPVVLEFEFFTNTTEPVYFMAKDQNRSKSIYFNREYIPVTPGKQKVELTLPFSPNVLQLLTFSKGNYTISAISTFNMKKHGMLDHDLADFLSHAEKFAQDFKYNSLGTYRSGSGKYVFKYVDAILDENGTRVPTPMQVDHVTGEVAIDESLTDHYTAQMIVTALLHENNHYRYDTKSEIDCDLNAAGIAVDRGYMKTEILGAFTSVFDDSPENIKRTNYIDNFLLGYNVNLRG